MKFVDVFALATTVDAAVAPALAVGATIGEFSVLSWDDGNSQWAYRNQPLYTFSRNRLPGDALGHRISEDWQVSTVTRNFRSPNVDVVWLDGYGATLTWNGFALYGGYPFEKRRGGRNLRDTFKSAY